MTDESRKKALALVHIAKGQLAMEEDVYRDLLERLTGKRSAAKLDNTQLKAVLDEFKRLGWQSKPRRDFGRRPNPAASKAKLIGKIEALLADRGLHWNYAHAIALKIYAVHNLNWLSLNELRSIVKAIQSTNEEKKCIEDTQFH